MEDVAIECAKFGPVKSVKPFERNPDGAVAVVFKEHESAEACIEKMNGRYFDQRKLEAGKSSFYLAFLPYPSATLSFASLMPSLSCVLTFY